ncbi:hypothetical protein ACTXT7_001643 [Hymenolepis weldensis]
MVNRYLYFDSYQSAISPANSAQSVAALLASLFLKFLSQMIEPRTNFSKLFTGESFHIMSNRFTEHLTLSVIQEPDAEDE